MPRKIIWSEEAEFDYASNIDYLLEEWSEKEAREFVDNASQIIEMIRKMPEAFPISDYKGIRKALVCKQISLLYLEDKSDIILLRFWDNRQKPLK